MTADEAAPLLVLGARPYALEILDVLEGCPGWRVVGFVENMERERAGQTHGGLPVHWIDDVGAFADDHFAIASLSTTHRSRFVEQAAAHGLRFATAVHETAHVSRRSTLGEGTRIGVRVIVAAYTTIGRHVAVNRGATIGHHTTIGDWCTVQPMVGIAGNCRVGERTYFGIGAKVVDGITIGAGSIVGAGAVVTRDVPERCLVLGVPAKVVKEDIEPK